MGLAGNLFYASTPAKALVKGGMEKTFLEVETFFTQDRNIS